jgi:hypothetical protein
MSEQMILLENIIEEYAWVDKLLEEKYNLYALTEENIDDFIEAGLLNEYYTNIDNKMEKKWDNISKTSSTSSSHSNITNPFCNLEVEQIIMNNMTNDSVSDISSNDTLFDEYMDAYDSDEYCARIVDNNIYWFK